MTTTLKPIYGASVAFTVTNLNGLTTNSNWQSVLVDNTSDLADDQVVTFVIKMGTSPTAGTSVLFWFYEIMNDVPTYPDGITGSEGTASFTSSNVLFSGMLKSAGFLTIDSTSNRVYYMTSRLSQAFGMDIPKKWGIVIANQTGASFNTSGNVVTRTPVQFQMV